MVSLLKAIPLTLGGAEDVLTMLLHRWEQGEAGLDYCASAGL
jgi:hypothetical protein